MNTEALSLALIHFVWQGGALALLLAVILCIARRPGVRYAAACTALFAMPVCFAVTYWMALPAPPRSSLPRSIPLFEIPVPAAGDALDVRPEAAPIPMIILFWAAGVVLLYAWRLAGWIAAQRLRRSGVCAAPSPWPETLRTLAQRLRLSRPVVLLESSLAHTPLTIGVLRPVILIPVGILAGLPTEQVEAILLHELAHIRRFDYLVNLAQTLVEGLLFYHPAVWWVSHTIRTEREFCCDDAVIAATGNAPAFAHALSALEHHRSQETALAATGGNLMLRIRRLLGKPAPRAAAGPAMGLVLLLASCAALAAWQPDPRPEPAPAPPVPAPQQPQAQPAPVTDAFQNWIDQEVVWIATAEERAEFARLQTAAERQQFIEQFWLRRDPTPDTPQNELRDEHYRRIAWANDRFASAELPGWKTDRGMIYIKFGPSDEREEHPVNGQTFAYEKWRYRYIEGVGSDVIVEFVDKEGNNEYRMTWDPAEKDALLRIPGARTTFYQQFAAFREATSPYERWLNEEVRWIVTDEERNAFGRLENDSERQTFIEQFWLRRDPTPDTAANEYREEHYRRIAWANDKFATPGVPGWLSDRGMMYVSLGPPDEREEHPGEDVPERWRYRHIDGVGDDVIVEFELRPNGEYRLRWHPGSTTASVRPAAGESIFDRMPRFTNLQKAPRR